MKGRPVDALVYEQMFKTSKLGDCQNFNALLQRQLVPEVRLETAAFYGSLDSKEAQYPGLDYSHPPHRMRLSRFPWHRRLFRAFDNLGLTKSEIASLTKWEGTRWAKERFEKENSVTIEDTTGKEIEPWVDPVWIEGQDCPEGHEIEIEEMEDVEGEAEEEREVDDDNGEEDSDAEIESIGFELNERLRANNGSMDEQWEQWMKEITESGAIDLAHIYVPGSNSSSERDDTISHASSFSSIPSRLREGRAEISTPIDQSVARQLDGHRTRTPIPASSFPNSFTPASVISPASARRHAASTAVPIVPARNLHWARYHPRQAQPPRS